MSFTLDELQGMTVEQLRAVARELSLVRYSKATKSNLIQMIRGSEDTETPTVEQAADVKTAINMVEVDPALIMIRVSCGASSGEFPVAGQKLAEVYTSLRDVLNIPDSPLMFINSVSALGDAVIQPGSTVEFMARANNKG